MPCDDALIRGDPTGATRTSNPAGSLASRLGWPDGYKSLQVDTGRYGTDKAVLQSAWRIGVVNTEAFPIITRLTLPALLCVVTASALGQDANVEPSRPLALPVPSGTLTRTWGSPAREDTARLPGLGAQPSRPDGADGLGSGGGHRSDLPYGSGYEARHGQGGGWHGRGRGR